MKKFIAALVVFFSISIFAYSTELPNGYKNIQLGMTFEQVKEILDNDITFGDRGDRDISLLPGENRILIQTNPNRHGFSFLDECYFQLYDGKLYIITINMNQEKMDHYSVFSTLTKKYGNPNALNPKKSTWENSKVIMALERPLALKYTDKIVADQIKNQALVDKTAMEKIREQFLEGL